MRMVLCQMYMRKPHCKLTYLILMTEDLLYPNITSNNVFKNKFDNVSLFGWTIDTPVTSGDLLHQERWGWAALFALGGGIHVRCSPRFTCWPLGSQHGNWDVLFHTPASRQPHICSTNWAMLDRLIKQLRFFSYTCVKKIFDTFALIHDHSTFSLIPLTS